MHKCDIGIQKFIAARKFNANEKMESNVAPFVGCPFGKNRDQHQLYFERGCDGDGRSNNIYKWVNPEYNANRQKINRPKMNKEKPYNRKHGDPDNKRLGPPIHHHQYWVQHLKKSDGSRGHLKWISPDYDSFKRKIKDGQHRDQEKMIYIDGLSTQFVRGCGAHNDFKWVNTDYDSSRGKTNCIEATNM